jgi:hypothetical protein
MRSIMIGIGLLLMLACGNLPAQTPKSPEITNVPSSAPYRWSPTRGDEESAHRIRHGGAREEDSCDLH